MAQPSKPNSIILAIKGLHLNPSTFGNSAPNGALTVADNVVIDRPSIVETRRGFDNTFSDIDSASLSMFQFAGTLLIHDTNDDLNADINNDGNFVPFAGTYQVPDVSYAASRIRGVEANKNFYFITSNGTYRLDSVLNNPRLAGAPAGLSGSGITTGVTGFLPDQTNVAYRIVFGYKDANNQLVLGAPSSRIIVSNTSGGSADVILTFQQPKEVQASPANFFYQVYRSNNSANLLTQPDDECSLVYEEVCTGAATITVTDITPDSLKGAALYTNTGVDGILQSNYRPPWCTDICLYKGYTFYANTRNTHTALLTLIASGASNGADAIVPGDTITFTSTEFGGPSFTLTAVAGANNLALGWFQVSDTGNPGLDIQVTASNIALVMNGYASNTFLAGYYTSNVDEIPGRLKFERLDLEDYEFIVTSSRGTCWEQPLPVDSNNEARPNRIYYSKPNQPEAVPLVNYVDVGSVNLRINRIVPLRDGVMIMKQDGVFRISGAAAPFTVTPIDYNVRILADNTAAELDNKVYFLSDQGVVALSDSDARIMSFVLDRTIIENTSPTLFPNLQRDAWGIAYQSDRKYILSMPTTGSDATATQQYVYNHITEVWTKWTLKVTCGIVFRRDGKLYLGSGANTAPSSRSYVYQERKTFTSADYADNEYTTNNTTVGFTDTIVVNNPSLPPNVQLEAGWTITQTVNGAQARIVSTTVGPSFTTIVLDREQSWTAGDVVIYTPVYSEIETIQLDCENPGMNKQFSEIVYVFSEQDFTQITARLSSNTVGVPVIDYLIPQRRGGWGIDPWGDSPWGGSPSGQGKIRRYVPQKVQRAGWLYLNLQNAEAFTKFGFSGFELFYKDTSSRQK